MRTSCLFLSMVLLATPAVCQDQNVSGPDVTPRYKLVVLEGAGQVKRVKKGRISAEAVVKVTDANDVPVPGVAVAFSIPSFAGGGATFATGSLTSIAATNAAGIASSGSFMAGTGGAFSMGVTASVPGGALTAAIPVNAATVAAAGGAAGGTAAGAGGGAGGAGAGVSAGVIAGVAAGAVAVAAVAAKVLTGGKKTPDPAKPPVPSATIGLGTGITFGPGR